MTAHPNRQPVAAIDTPVTMALNFAAVQFNPTVGALAHNREGLFTAYKAAVADGADIVVAPEHSLTGYPLEDLVLRESFLEAVYLARNNLIEDIFEYGESAAFIFGAPEASNQHVYNTAIFVDPEKKTVSITRKHELPNYGVFDEKRTYSAGPLPDAIEWRNMKIGLMICEDAWFPRVSKHLATQGADILISINGSPFEHGKDVVRHDIVRERITETGLPFLYVNMVGGQDELVFDGCSFMYDEHRVHSAQAFKEGIFIFPSTMTLRENPSRMDVRGLPRRSSSASMQKVYEALVLGTRDYLNKQGFKSVVIGYSGGVDSGLVAAIACDAIGAENVHLVRMPSKFSSEGSLIDAAAGAKRLGAHMRTIDIESTVEALRGAYKAAWHGNTHPHALQHTAETFPWNNSPLTGTADENIQARARGAILMAISNQEGHMVLTTGNKSEVSVGYCTLYGDMNGGFNPLKDCYKTIVFELCKWRNRVDEPALYGFLGPYGTVVPNAIIDKPPSAELREGQKDEDSLPPYEVLDYILLGLIENELSVAKMQSYMMALPAFDSHVHQVVRIRNLVDAAEYKRRQAAPGIKITAKIHGRDRRYPIVNHWRKV